MKKSELELHFQTYEEYTSFAEQARASGDLPSAVQHSVRACESAEGMMRYTKKYRPEEFRFAPAFDFVAHMAPLILETKPIATVGQFLRSSRWIKKNCPVDA